MPKPIYKTAADVKAARIRGANYIKESREDDMSARERVKNANTKNEIIRGQNSQTAAATTKEREGERRLKLARSMGKTTTKTRRMREGRS